MRVAVFSKYFGYNVGGAERSVLSIMRSLEDEGHDIVAYINASPRQFGAASRPFALPSSWEIREFTLPVDWTRFRFVEYLANYAALRSVAGTMSDIDMLYAYGHMSPAVLMAFSGKRVYLVRDEYGLGWNRNYYQGWRAAVQELYFAMEFPLRALWMRDLIRVFRSSSLIANSRFIANEMRRISGGRTVQLVTPQLDAEALRVEYEAALSDGYHVPRGVVVVGDNVLKGGDIVRRVALLMPNVRFYVFDRCYKVAKKDGNITFMPWQETAGAIYRYADLVMTPSRVSEAFPRVIIEAQSLGIPVVASSRGGIPEAIFDKSMLVYQIEAPTAWVAKIRALYASMEQVA